jgi:hypothetical protein
MGIKGNMYGERTKSAFILTLMRENEQQRKEIEELQKSRIRAQWTFGDYRGLLELTMPNDKTLLSSWHYGKLNLHFVSLWEDYPQIEDYKQFTAELPNVGSFYLCCGGRRMSYEFNHFIISFDGERVHISAKDGFDIMLRLIQHCYDIGRPVEVDFIDEVD